MSREDKNTVLCALRDGLEYSAEALLDFDNRLGRDRPHHREEAERMEADIERIRQAIGIMEAQP